jgi:hypothetical protein
VHGQVGAAVEEGLLDLAGEEALVAETGDGRVGRIVAAGLDD